MRQKYDVPMVMQEQSPLCWLACAIMILQFKGRRTMEWEELMAPTAEFAAGRPDLRAGSSANYPTQAEVDQHTARMGFRAVRLRELSRFAAFDGAGRVHATATRSIRPTAHPAMPPEGRLEPITRTTLNLLRTHGPFILGHECGAFSYGLNRPAPRTGRHAVVITGVDTDRGIYYFNNPWGQKDVQTSIASINASIERTEGGGNAAITHC